MCTKSNKDGVFLGEIFIKKKKKKKKKSANFAIF